MSHLTGSTQLTTDQVNLLDYLPEVHLDSQALFRNPPANSCYLQVIWIFLLSSRPLLALALSDRHPQPSQCPTNVKDGRCFPCDLRRVAEGLVTSNPDPLPLDVWQRWSAGLGAPADSQQDASEFLTRATEMLHHGYGAVPGLHENTALHRLFVSEWDVRAECIDCHTPVNYHSPHPESLLFPIAGRAGDDPLALQELVNQRFHLLAPGTCNYKHEDTAERYKVDLSLTRPPPILQLRLFRSDAAGGQKSQRRVFVPEVLHLDGHRYRLSAALIHHGSSYRSGHYTCIARSDKTELDAASGWARFSTTSAKTTLFTRWTPARGEQAVALSYTLDVHRSFNELFTLPSTSTQPSSSSSAEITFNAKSPPPPPPVLPPIPPIPNDDYNSMDDLDPPSDVEEPHDLGDEETADQRRARRAALSGSAPTPHAHSHEDGSAMNVDPPSQNTSDPTAAPSPSINVLSQSQLAEVFEDDTNAPDLVKEWPAAPLDVVPLYGAPPSQAGRIVAAVLVIVLAVPGVAMISTIPHHCTADCASSCLASLLVDSASTYISRSSLDASLIRRWADAMALKLNDDTTMRVAVGCEKGIAALVTTVLTKLAAATGDETSYLRPLHFVDYVASLECTNCGTARAMVSAERPVLPVALRAIPDSLQFAVNRSFLSNQSEYPLECRSVVCEGSCRRHTTGAEHMAHLPPAIIISIACSGRPSEIHPTPPDNLEFSHLLVAPPSEPSPPHTIALIAFEINPAQEHFIVDVRVCDGWLRFNSVLPHQCPLTSLARPDPPAAQSKSPPPRPVLAIYVSTTSVDPLSLLSKTTNGLVSRDSGPLAARRAQDQQSLVLELAALELGRERWEREEASRREAAAADQQKRVQQEQEQVLRDKQQKDLLNRAKQIAAQQLASIGTGAAAPAVALTPFQHSVSATKRKSRPNAKARAALAASRSETGSSHDTGAASTTSATAASLAMHVDADEAAIDLPPVERGPSMLVPRLSSLHVLHNPPTGTSRLCEGRIDREAHCKVNRLGVIEAGSHYVEVTATRPLHARNPFGHAVPVPHSCYHTSCTPYSVLIEFFGTSDDLRKHLQADAAPESTVTELLTVLQHPVPTPLTVEQQRALPRGSSPRPTASSPSIKSTKVTPSKRSPPHTSTANSSSSSQFSAGDSQPEVIASGPPPPSTLPHFTSPTQSSARKAKHGAQKSSVLKAPPAGKKIKVSGPAASAPPSGRRSQHPSSTTPQASPTRLHNLRSTSARRGSPVTPSAADDPDDEKELSDS